MASQDSLKGFIVLKASSDDKVAEKIQNIKENTSGYTQAVDAARTGKPISDEIFQRYYTNVTDQHGALTDLRKEDDQKKFAVVETTAHGDMQHASISAFDDASGKFIARDAIVLQAKASNYVSVTQETSSLSSIISSMKADLIEMEIKAARNRYIGRHSGPSLTDAQKAVIQAARDEWNTLFASKTYGNFLIFTDSTYGAPQPVGRAQDNDKRMFAAAQSSLSGWVPDPSIGTSVSEPSGVYATPKNWFDVSGTTNLVQTPVSHADTPYELLRKQLDTYLTQYNSSNNAQLNQKYTIRKPTAEGVQDAAITSEHLFDPTPTNKDRIAFTQ